MVTSIQLGNFFSANGRTVLGGVGGSGLDTESLIKALTEARALPATQLQDRITQNAAKASALSDFRALLSKFKQATDALRNPPGVNNASENAFRFTTASVGSNTSVAGTAYMGVSVAPGATLASYNIGEITSLARAQMQQTGNFSIQSADDAVVSSSPDPGEFKAGTFTLRGETITLNDGDSLTTVAAKFNAVSDETGISASVVKVSSNTFKLTFTATETGTASDFDLNDVYDEMSNPDGILVDADGIFDQLAITDVVGQEASNAVFVLNGITITRSTNSINDVVSGVTFNLLQATPEDTELTVTVGADTTTAQNSIINFVNAYNDIRLFFAQQTQLNDDGTFAEGAVLADNSIFRNMVNNITAQVSSIVAGISGSNPSRLSDIGITFTTQEATLDTPRITNILNVDDGKLASALATNLAGVANVFGFDFQSNNPDLKIFSRTNALATNAFTLNVNPMHIQRTGLIELATSDLQIVYASPGSGQIKAGVITINGVEIELEDGDSLDDVVQKFNDESDNTGMEASLEEVDPGVFQITFTSEPIGSNNNFDLTDGDVDADGAFDLMGITAEGLYQATYDNGSGPVTIELNYTPVPGGAGYSLKGTAGTPLEGLVMVYGTALSASIEVTATQGIADKLYNISNDAAKLDTGPIANELATLKSSDARLNDQIAKITQQVADYRNQLLEKFGALEQALSRVNTLLQSLDAQQQARNNS